MIKRSFRTALAFVAGAVLFLSCHPREANFTNEVVVTMPDTTITADTAQLPVSNQVTDSLLYLGSTGYTVRLPKDYQMVQESDSLFSFALINDTCRCARLKLEWNFRPGKIPGTRPIGNAQMFILENTVGAKEFPLNGISCIVRTTTIRAGETNIHIDCIAPKGESMERLCSIAASLAKSEK